MRHSLYWLIVGVLLAGAGHSCVENDPAEVAAFLQSIEPGLETATDVEIIYSDSARVKVSVSGPVMQMDQDYTNPRQVFPDGIQVLFFDQNRSVESQLTAQYGLRLEALHQVIVRDSVVWQSTEGEKLETEELIWDDRRQLVYTDKFVVITRPDEIITGYGFEANQDFTYSRVKAIDGRIKINE